MRPALLIAAAAGALALVLALALGSQAPADRADELVPFDVIAYVHASTDPDRAQDRDLLERLERFDAFADLRDRIPAALRADEVLPWLGDEAAVALTHEGVLVVLAIGDREGALAFAEDFDGGRAEVQGEFVLVGTDAAVQSALDLEKGKSLAEMAVYAEVAGERPDERSVDAWFDGRAAAMALPPRVAAVVGGRQVAADLSATGDGLRLRARRLGGASAARDFAPSLLDGAPDDAFAYLSVRGLATLGMVLPDAAGDAAPEVGATIGPLLDALGGEVAVTAAPATGDPAVTLLAHADDPEAARAALADLQAVIVAALTGAGEQTGQLPVFVDRELDGVEAFALTLAGGGELVYAVDGDRVAISNGEEGVRSGLEREDGLAGSGDFQAAVGDVPESAHALAFLAASQLLELADEAGLDASAAYRAVRPDLARIRALGAVVRRQGDDTTVELNLLFP